MAPRGGATRVSSRLFPDASTRPYCPEALFLFFSGKLSLPLCAQLIAQHKEDQSAAVSDAKTSFHRAKEADSFTYHRLLVDLSVPPHAWMQPARPKPSLAMRVPPLLPSGSALAYPSNAVALPERLPSRTILPSNMTTTSRRLQTPLEPHQVLTRVKVKVKVSFPIARHSTSRAKAKAKENSPRKAQRKAPRKAPNKAPRKDPSKALEKA